MVSGFCCGQRGALGSAGVWTLPSHTPGLDPSIAIYLGCVIWGKLLTPEHPYLKNSDSVGMLMIIKQDRCMQNWNGSLTSLVKIGRYGYLLMNY